MSFSLDHALQLLNLLFIPLVIFIVKIERALVKLDMLAEHFDEKLRDQGRDIRAAHRRMDQAGVAPARASDG